MLMRSGAPGNVCLECLATLVLMTTIEESTPGWRFGNGLPGRRFNPVKLVEDLTGLKTRNSSSRWQPCTWHGPARAWLYRWLGPPWAGWAYSRAQSSIVASHFSFLLYFNVCNKIDTCRNCYGIIKWRFHLQNMILHDHVVCKNNNRDFSNLFLSKNYL